MVNYSDPATIAQDFEILLKLWHFVNGVFIWEFLTTLNFEWDVFRGNRPYRWTIWVYSTARVSTLLAVILNMVGFDSTTPINCQVWASFEMFFGYFAVITASLLIVLRIIAIWNKNKIVIAIALSIWVTDIVLFINGTVRLRSTWSTEDSTCLLLNLENTEYSAYAVLVTDVVLLLIMLVGLLRMRIESGGAHGLGSLLWKQGLIWLLLVTIGEVPSTVLMILNLNAVISIMPQTPSLIIVTIAATTMYRSLVNFCSNDVSSSKKTPRSERAVSEMRFQSGTIPLNKMEATLRTERDQYSTSQSSTVNKDKGVFKVHELNVNADVESGP